MSLGEVLFWLALTALFIILNGLFVAIEFALVALRRSRVHEMVEQRKPLSGVIQKLQKNMDTSIAGAQLGITVASLAIGWLGEHALTDALGNAINSIPGLANVYIPPGTGFVISFLILSVLHVVIGEQVPKFWALQLPEWTCRMLAVPFKFFCWLTYPLIWFMNLLARCVLAMLRIEKAKEGEHSAHTAEELEILFEASRKAGELKAQETDLLKRTLELADLTVKEIMVPRTKMDAISDDLSLRDVLSVVARTKHGKLPVFRGSSDRILGVLISKDLFDLWSKLDHSNEKNPQVAAVISEAGPQGGSEGSNTGSWKFSLASLVRQAFFVPESMPADVLLQEFRKRNIQMAIVVDEFGGTSGLITLEDLLEQIVGEIWDEYDTPQSGVERLADGKWKVAGSVTQFELRLATKIAIDCSRCVTVAGAVIEANGGRLPKVGAAIQLQGCIFKILEIQNHSIAWLEVTQVTQAVA